jgi:Tfp pilus assembly protein PilO
MVVIIAIVIMCSYVTVSHIGKQKDQIRKENEVVSMKLNELNSAETSLKQLQTDLSAAEAELIKLNERIPESARIGDFLRHLDYLMEKRKMVLVSLKLPPTVEEKSYTKIPIRLVFKGLFGNLYEFLYDLETMNRMLVAENVVIKKSREQENCDVELSANLFER